ncbi:MAG: HEAT repeat domain-containing protein [Planctomycetia bacterium]|nr:HEAT repeat domain-containing protein [Planctomycetia bacterium]
MPCTHVADCRRQIAQALLAIAATFVAAPATFAVDPALTLEKGDHIAIIGNTLADRMQHSGWLETYVHALHPDLDLVFRNLGFSGDELKNRVREDNFGTPDQWLEKVQASVVFCFFGFNEAWRGPAGLDGFKKDLADTIDGMRAQKYDGRSAPRLVFFSPIAHEDLKSPHLPDGSANNTNLALYTAAMQEVCQAKGVAFIDLFAATKELYAKAAKPLTMNGIHLLEHGDRAVAEVIVKDLFGAAKPAADEPAVERLRQAILDRNYYWFSRYRVVDGYNVFGGRSKLAWFGQSNADVMMREMEIFDVMTANRDARVWAVAKGGDLVVKDDNIPAELEVKTNIPGKLEGGKHEYLGGKEAIGKMKIAEGMEANLFASEEMFPELANPVQMAVDTDGRIFASVWPSYPHWNPTEPRRDRIVCLPDDDGDGVADRCVTFADELNSVTGFEFWGGGMLVAALPEIWFLKDTDGDDKADVKIRMLQGLDSADSHHSANAMLVGPDGWLYWSRGVFNVSAMETPTKTVRSGATGVHRFNPRTFEVEFHFPIGPNPHGDVFDQWGYQFANDGTSGTGNYVNIGKGVGNKQWFRKRVRPVPATGLLSSSHFPEKNRGNFLICNSIGFLGVLQHEITYDGADITAREIEPILVSDDPNFRPTDLEIGADGALYVSDWANAIVGHMQHNMRDPNRDHSHGRIYRITATGRPLVPPVRLKGKPIQDVCQQAFFAKENTTRYRGRLELSGRPADEVVSQVGSWTKSLDPAKPDDAQALLECLWVFEEQRVPNEDLLKRVFAAGEPRVRAAAIRTLGHWGPQIAGWEPLLLAAATDSAALVRAEAVKAAVSFEGAAPAETIFEVATRPLDPELDTVLKYARGKINVDKVVADALAAKQPLSKAARAFVLANSNADLLLKLERTEDVCQAILSRQDASVDALRQALAGLADIRKTSSLPTLLQLIRDRDAAGKPDSLDGLSKLLAEQPAADLAQAQRTIEELAATAKSPRTRQIAYAAWIKADGSGDGAFLAASKGKESLRDVLAAVPLIADEKLRSGLYSVVRPLLFELPPGIEKESASGLQQSGLRVAFYHPNPPNAAIETFAGLTPKATGIASQITLDVPQKTQREAFGLTFSGFLQVPMNGKYTFFLASDDGSRLYLDGKLVVNNDGLHGMGEKAGGVDLTAGSHPIAVTYFDNGGGNGLSLAWTGPDLPRQPLGADRLATVVGVDTVHDVAIRSLRSIPGHGAEKFRDLDALIKAGRSRATAIEALGGIPEKDWSQAELPELADNVVGFLTSIPAAGRTSGVALEAMTLARAIAAKLPSDKGKAITERLQNLDVPVIAIGTVLERMIYDKESLAVQAGKPVEFRFSNSDAMPHNFVLVRPGSLEEVGLAAEASARDADAKDRHYVPKSDKVLLASRMLESGQSQTIAFEAPQEPGIYPYVCTYPGHWRRMYGALTVVADIDAYEANPDAYLASHPLPLRDELLASVGRNKEWAYDDLITAVKAMPSGRSFDVGRKVFAVANCVGCHKLGGAGQEVGPDLTKIDPAKHTAEHLLKSICEPSQEIAEKFQSNVFVLDSGKVVTGMVVAETADECRVMVDPLARCEPVVVAKPTIDERTKSPVSIMPKGMLNRLSQEEILDLMAYLLAKGDKSHPVYAAKP